MSDTSGRLDETQGAGLRAMLEGVAERARGAGVFGEVTVDGERLRCEAAGSAEPAEYRIDLGGGSAWVSLVMEDRWQSESIEADLMHTGDKLEELLDEELVEQGYEGGSLSFEHYRSDDMLFTFRSKLPIAAGDFGSAGSIETATRVLMGYEACFRQLGDMDAENDEE